MGSFLATPANSLARLDGKTAVITGANTGIGKVTAKDFYERGARVILACRNLEKAQEAIDEIKKQCESKENLGELALSKLDLSSLKSVRACAEELLKNEKEINILLNNAGVMMIQELTRTEDGHEMQFGTNHLGHFLFTLLLMPKLIQSTPVRIVNVSSAAHFLTFSLDLDDLNFENRKYGALKAYVQSKLSNILFTTELANKLKENKIEGINVYCLHPGSINTDLTRHVEGNPFINISKLFFKTPEEGAQTSIYCSTHEKCANETGLYYAECKPCCSSKTSQNKELAKKLWLISLKMVGLNEDYDPFKSSTNL